MPSSPLLKGLGPSLVDIPLESVQPTPNICPAKKDLVNLASYNLLPKYDKKIIVPGSPSIWIPPMAPFNVRADSGKYITDPNAYIFPRGPLEPLFRAILALNVNFQMDGIDLVTDRRNIRLLLGFVSGSKKPFRINVEMVESSTLLFSIWSPKKINFVQGFGGYGREYEKSFTRNPRYVRSSIIHNRVIRYTLGTLRIILRFEVDACMPSPSTKNNRTTKKSMHTPTGITVVSAGDLVASSGIVEIKTGPVGKQLDNSKTLEQMWFSQTPILCTGHYQSNGTFLPPKVTEVEKSGKLAGWEERNQDAIQKLIRVLEMIRQTVENVSQKKCALVHEGNRVLKVYTVKNPDSNDRNSSGLGESDLHIPVVVYL
ncbi:hypothetical protein BDW59DRAFT_179662 [Aspergillus cavernicola]|uniref:Geranylgeranyl pyrophosphate synthetase n=1 Tax=Aspergillus cavernicola TaxID=176166 RepID=A0ABR4IED1_9EURO